LQQLWIIIKTKNLDGRGMDQYHFTNGRLILTGPLLISNVGPLYEA
jgi:hypothetical protein